MNPLPISVQLYTVREAAKKEGLPSVIKKIAQIGYAGVEFAGLHDMKPKEVKKIIDDLGLVASSAHGAVPDKDNVNEIIDTAKTLGYQRHITGFGPNNHTTKEKTLASAAQMQAAALLLKGSGVALGYHNHWWEFDKTFDGVSPMEIFINAAPDVFAQIDTYWVKAGGADVPQVLKKLGNRVFLLHIKDGPAVREQPQTAVGKGVMDWPGIMKAVPKKVDWLVVELDACETDMFEAVAGSYSYLISKGYAKGKK